MVQQFDGIKVEAVPIEFLPLFRSLGKVSHIPSAVIFYYSSCGMAMLAVKRLLAQLMLFCRMLSAVS